MKLRTDVIMLIGLIIWMSSCQSTSTNNQSIKETKVTDVSGITSNTPAKYIPKKKGLKRAYFASGCFWCVEAIYESVKGVEESVSGYSGGHTDNPTYESSNTGTTGHAEAVEIFYDSTKIDFGSLVDVYFASQNVTQVNGQGPDRGSQYRSIIFYQNEKEKAIIEKKVAIMSRRVAPKKVAAEVKAFEMFWVGEDYHQNFERLHPNHNYIKAVSIPRLQKFQGKSSELVKEDSH